MYKNTILTQHGDEGDRFEWRSRMSKLVTAVCLTLILVWEVICLYWFYVVSDRILFSENSNEVIWHLLFVVLTMPNYMATCFLYWSAVGIHESSKTESDC